MPSFKSFRSDVFVLSWQHSHPHTHTHTHIHRDKEIALPDYVVSADNKAIKCINTTAPPIDF